jgi:hypothetical protein
MVKPPDRIRVYEQLNIIKAEIAGLQKIEKPEEAAAAWGSTWQATRRRWGRVLRAWSGG